MNVRTKKISIVLIAAVCGAAFFDAMIVAANVMYHVWGKGQPAGAKKDFVASLGLILSLPSAVLTSSDGKMPNPYIVNGLIGAIVFAALAAFWLLFKNTPKEN